MQSLELVLEENVGNTRLDGLCVLYTSSCTPVMLQPMDMGPGHMGPPPGVVSSELSSYLGGMGDKYGVRSPTTASATVEYNPIVSQEIANYAGGLGERIGVISGPTTPVIPINDGISNYGNYLNERMGVASPSQSPGVMGFESPQLTSQTMNYASNLGNQYSVRSGPTQAVELSVRSTSFDPLQIMNVMNESSHRTKMHDTTLSYMGSLGNQMNVSSPPAIPDLSLPKTSIGIDYKPAFEMPKMEPIMPRTDFMEKPLFDNLSRFKETSFMPKTEPILDFLLKPKTESLFDPMKSITKNIFKSTKSIIPKFETPKIDLVPKCDLIKETIMDLPGKTYGLPSSWEPPKKYGIGGPGEARSVFPGLVERQRLDLDGHGTYGPHINKEYYSIFNKGKKPVKNIHIDIFKKDI